MKRRFFLSRPTDRQPALATKWKAVERQKDATQTAKAQAEAINLMDAIKSERDALCARGDYEAASTHRIDEYCDANRTATMMGFLLAKQETRGEKAA